MGGWHKYCDECEQGLYIWENSDATHTVYSAFETHGGHTPLDGEWVLAREVNLGCGLCISNG